MQWHSIIDGLTGYIRAGGGIMLPLMFMSIAIWTLAIIKGMRLLRDRRIEVAPSECARLLNADMSASAERLAPWQTEILKQYQKQRCDDHELNRTMLDSMRMRQEAIAMRSVATILIMASVAPLLGLLGTVSGMIMTFDVISEFGTGNARALASGISEALITTQSGLVVAVPGLILGAFLLRRIWSLKGRMKLFCIGLQYADANGEGRS